MTYSDKDTDQPEHDKTAREIVGLNTKEVSLVDKPAILREFLLWKRNQKQEDTMGAFESTEKAKKPEEKEEEEKAKDVKAKEEEEKEEEDKKKAKEEEEKEEEEEDKKKGKKGKDKQEEEEQDEEGAMEGSKAKVNKGEFVIKFSPDGEVEVSGERVEKGKRFTTDRITALKNSATQLLTMLAGVDKDAAQGLITDLSKSVLPGEIKWSSESTLASTDVKKSIEDAFKPVMEKLDDVSKRVEKIEETRPASKSTDDDGTKDVDTEKGFWSGLL